jgi:hypothetical protein
MAHATRASARNGESLLALADASKRLDKGVEGVHAAQLRNRMVPRDFQI